MVYAKIEPGYYSMIVDAARGIGTFWRVRVYRRDTGERVFQTDLFYTLAGAVEYIRYAPPLWALARHGRAVK